MGLPHELLPFAENFYRRFPEEFVALGMPGLEQVFDLRPDGSRSRKISETNTEKKVEITIRRWQEPSLFPPPVYHPSYSSLMAPPSMHNQFMYGAQQSLPPYQWPPQVAPAPAMPRGSYDAAWSQCQPRGPQPSAAPPADANSTEAQMTAQLTRLETALSMLKPQIEAAVRNSQQPQVQAQQRTYSDSVPSFSQSQSSHNKPESINTHDPLPRDRDSPPSSLRSRRNMAQLQMGQAKPPRDISPNAALQQSVKQLIPANANDSVEDSQPRKDTIASVGEKKDRNPPRINAVRMLPNAMDPESPRSPGKFSVWK